MCGRYVDPDEAALEQLFNIDRRNWMPFNPPRYNVAPTLQVPIITLAEGGTTELQGARWGLIPHWWKKESPPSLTFNARSEEAAEKPMWRDSLKSRRCIMPARGWYEWNENQQARNPSGKPCNQPYFLYCPSEPAVAIAGIWSVWKREGADPMLTCALLTKEAAPAIAHIHHRMPVVLYPAQFAAWLDPSSSDADLIAAARVDLEGYPISTRVNSVRNDSPDLLERVEV